jgi:hypothetical protein
MLLMVKYCPEILLSTPFILKMRMCILRKKTTHFQDKIGSSMLLTKSRKLKTLDMN